MTVIKNIITRYNLGDREQTFRRLMVKDIQFNIRRMSDCLDEWGDVVRRAHMHNFYEILWFQKYKSKHMIDFKEWDIGDNTLVFISPGQVHNFVGEARPEGVMIQFSDELLADLEGSESDILKYKIFNAFDSSPCYTLSAGDAEPIGQIVRQMEMEYQRKNAFAQKDCLRYLVKMFLINIERSAKKCDGVKLSAANSSNQLYLRFRKLLEENFTSMHTVKEYAWRLNVSTKYLTNCVVASVNSTPLKCINNRITLEAKRLLTYSPLKSKEIAYKLGFADPSYFIKFFRQQTGLLPSEFKKG